jgi:F420-dependent oxidoreductase-like protein
MRRTDRLERDDDVRPEPTADPRAGQRWRDPSEWKPRMGLMLSAHQLGGTPPEALFDRLTLLAQSAEAAGFDSLWVPDHFVQMTRNSDVGEASLEAYTTLAALGAVTDRLRLGTSVASVTHRHPPILAKQIVTIDVISHGRAVLGIGWGWSEAEHAAYGLEFDSARQRSEQLEEAVLICRSMFTEPRTSFDGRYFQVADAMNVPLPLSRFGPPVMIGGAGKRFTLPLVARLADICNPKGSPEQLKENLAELERLCAQYGRDPDTLWRTQLKSISVGATHEAAEDQWSDVERRMMDDLVTGTHDEVVEQLGRYVELGLDGLMAILPYAGCTPEHIERVAAALDEVLPPAREVH